MLENNVRVCLAGTMMVQFRDKSFDAFVLLGAMIVAVGAYMQMDVESHCN